jgi:hypothetical protein
VCGVTDLARRHSPPSNTSALAVLGKRPSATARSSRSSEAGNTSMRLASLTTVSLTTAPLTGSPATSASGSRNDIAGAEQILCDNHRLRVHTDRA